MDHLFSGSRLRVSIILGIAVLLAVDWALLDVWKLKGTVVDPLSGKAVGSAWVIADFMGESPLFISPVSPDPMNRTTKCMGAAVTRTDEGGNFSFSEFALNRRLADKSAQLVVFKPGRLSYIQSSDIASSMLSGFPSVRISLASGPGDRQATPSFSTPEEALDLDSVQLTHSDELFHTLRVLVSDTCAPRLVAEVKQLALVHALQIANTFDERERVRAACAFVQESGRTWPRDATWPFDCDNLQFKKKAAPEVLALEAALAAKQGRQGLVQ